MANALLLNQVANGVGFNPPEHYNELNQRNALHQQQAQTHEQRNTLFAQGQDDRTRGLAEQEQQKQLESVREDLAGYLMAPPEARPQVWAQLAPKYQEDPNANPDTIISEFIRKNPGVLGPEVSQKVLLHHFAPKAATDNTPSNVMEWEHFNKLSPKDQQRYLEMRRSQKTVDMGGSVGVIGQGGQVVQQYDKTLPPQNQPENVKNEAKAKAQGAAVGELEGKAPALDSFKLTKQYMLDSIAKTPTGGQFGVRGKAAKVTDYQAVRQFENRKQQLSTELRTVFRIPGEGTLTDQEQAQYGIQLPDINNDKAINEQIVNELEARVLARMRQPQAAQPQQAAPNAEAPKRRRYNPQTGKIE